MWYSILQQAPPHPRQEIAVSTHKQTRASTFQGLTDEFLRRRKKINWSRSPVCVCVLFSHMQNTWLRIWKDIFVCLTACESAS